MMIFRITILRFSLLLFSLSLSASVFAREIDEKKEGDKRAKGVESKADRIFVQQDFDKAMKIYETAFDMPMSTEYSAALHLKTARLYLTLLNHTSSIPHYESAMAQAEHLFNSVDVCNYLDALRYSGQKMKAMSLARKYAYRDVYHSDMRYKNILHALTYENGFLPVGAPEFNVRAVKGANTSNSEFWVGAKDGEYFFASSKSRFHDPNKKFYHRTAYFPMNDNVEQITTKDKKSKKNGMLDMIPIYLQNGPLSFSRDMNKMVVTQISYDKGEGIGMTAQGLNAFQTKLYYSQFDNKRKGWSSFREALPQKKGYSYSHPFLYNNDRSILFASDLPGGFGGFDLYLAHWDEKTNTWGEAINLGAHVNTEGNEISPSIFNDRLIFASDGHSGFGGYDIYSILYENEKVVQGSLIHFDYPINTMYNDFSMLTINEDCGYIVSDRAIANKDDILYFERNNNKNKARRNVMFGMTEAQAISNGTMHIATMSEGITSTPREEVIPQSWFTEHMLTLYFDFEQFDLRLDAQRELQAWFDETDFGRVKSLLFEGYADEMGTEDYNHRLSERRAQTVARWLQGNGVDVQIDVVGRGQTVVDKDNALSSVYSLNDDSLRSRNTRAWNKIVWQNRKARRVDIKVVIK